MDEHADGGFFSPLFYYLINSLAGAMALQQAGRAVLTEFPGCSSVA